MNEIIWLSNIRSDTETGQNCCREKLVSRYTECRLEVFEALAVKTTILLKNESVCRCINLHNLMV